MQASTKPYILLFDSGSSHSWWNHKSIPKGCTSRKVEATNSQTLAGKMSSNLEIQIENVTFPEFFKTRKVGEITARIFTAKCRYNAIIGRYMLTELGIILNFKTQKMSWDDCHVLMQPFPSAETKKTVSGERPEPTSAEQLYLDLLEAEWEDDDTLPTSDLTETDEADFLNDEFYEDSEEGKDHSEMYQADKKQINVSKYETTDINEIVRGCSHLDQVQQNGLRDVLSNLFNFF